MTAVYVRERSYEVTIWPEGSDSINAGTWCLTVFYRGAGRWGIYRGASSGEGMCMDADGNWSAGERDDEDRDAWLDAHRFTRAAALRLAREWAPRLRLNGLTATEVLAFEENPLA